MYGLTGKRRNMLDPQLSRTGLRNVLQKKKRFSADGRNIVQSYLSNYESYGDIAVLGCIEHTEDLQAIILG